MQTFFDTTFVEAAERGIGFERIAKPSIQANHIDGPLLHFSDGQLHWLTVGERIRFWLGRTDAAALQRKLRPRLTAEIESRTGTKTGT